MRPFNANFRKGLYIVFIQLLSYSVILAQSSPENEDVSRFFDTPEEVQWIRHYQGAMNDMHDVLISLGSNGERYEGLIFFRRSREKFRLTGKVNDNALFLEEKNEEGKVCGYVTGVIMGDEIKADWQNVNKDISSFLNLSLVGKEAIRDQYCGDGKWIYGFMGHVEDIHIRLLLQKQSQNVLTGSIYLGDENRTYKLKGGLSGASHCRLMLVDDNHNKVGAMLGKLEEDGTFRGFFTRAKGPKTGFTLKTKKELLVSCIEYTDFSSAYSAIYPALEDNTAFNDFIFNIVKDWLSTSKEYSVQTILAKGENNPDARLSVRAYSWFELAHISDKIISGYLIGNNTWQGDYLQPFNFDLESNQVIEFTDLFDNSLHFQAFVSEQVGESLKVRPYYNNEDFQAWLYQQRFEHLTIKHDGIEFCSSYNPIYGTQKVTISYAALKPYFKNGNPLEHLYAVKN